MASRIRRSARRYSLAFGHGAVSVDLEVHDRAEAFAKAQRLVKEDRPATLFEDGEPLARISYSAAGFWTISERSADAA